MQTPSLGRIVIASVHPDHSNGADEAPAIVTRVWGEHPDGGWTVNLRVFLDGTTVPLSKTSVRLVEERPAELAADSHVAWWPPRV